MSKIDYNKELHIRYLKLMEKYRNKLSETSLTETSLKALGEPQLFMEQNDYIIHSCCLLQHWLNENNIANICRNYEIFMKYTAKYDIDFDSLDDVCKVVLTAAKYYVKAVYRVKEVYNL